MNEENPKKKSALDSIVMGAIIGTAIGSAIGMSVAPKKGSETREIIKEKTKDAGGVKNLAKRLLKRLLGKKEDQTPVKPALKTENMKDLPDEMEIIPPTSKPKHE